MNSLDIFCKISKSYACYSKLIKKTLYYIRAFFFGFERIERTLKPTYIKGMNFNNSVFTIFK
ncbi:MAG: hypothetical protein KH373_02630 [Ruminococcus sp.]|nr:hypothetical protein [Ruminococcus sp.]